MKNNCSYFICIVCAEYWIGRFCIIYKGYLAVLHQDETIECFRIRKHQETNDRDLYITIDLEVFYENSRVLVDDLEQLQNGIRAILDKNQDVQSKHLEKMIEKQYQILQIINKINEKKCDIRNDLERFKKLFMTVDNHITDILDKIDMINQRIQITQNDEQAKYIKRKNYEYKKVTELYNKKEQIANAIIELRKYEHNLSLNTDRLLFDNNIMLDKIFKNLIDLSQLIK